MPTEKPRVTFTISQERLSEVEAYRFDNKFKNQTQAILSLIEKGLSRTTKGNSSDITEAAQEDGPLDADPLRTVLLKNFDQLNQEGQERLVETSDDMVSSGKYIKSGSFKMGNEKLA